MSKENLPSKGDEAKTKFHFKAGETIRESVLRIINEELGGAREHLSRTGESKESAVHEARKSLKKVRAILRLLRPSLGAKTYQLNNTRLRDIGRSLSELRDAEALLEILDQLKERYQKQLDGMTLQHARDALAAREQQHKQAMQQQNAWAELQQQLTQVSDDAPSWALPDSRDFDALSEGLERAIREGRKAMAAAYDDPSPDKFHAWRKRVKDHWYHLRVLEKLWPEVMKGYADGVKQLEQALGDDHNLALLFDTIHHSPQEFGPAKERNALLNLIEVYQQELRAEARPIGKRLYAEKPGQMLRRLHRYWQIWHQEHHKSQ